MQSMQCMTNGPGLKTGLRDVGVLLSRPVANVSKKKGPRCGPFAFVLRVQVISAASRDR